MDTPVDQAPGAGALPPPPPELDAAANPPQPEQLGQFDPLAIKMAGEQLGNLVVMAIGAGFSMAGAKPAGEKKEQLLQGASARYAQARPELVLKLMRWTPELDFFGAIIYVVTTAEMEPPPNAFGAQADGSTPPVVSP